MITECRDCLDTWTTGREYCPLLSFCPSLPYSLGLPSLLPTTTVSNPPRHPNSRHRAGTKQHGSGHLWTCSARTEPEAEFIIPLIRPLYHNARAQILCVSIWRSGSVYRLPARVDENIAGCVGIPRYSFRKIAAGLEFDSDLGGLASFFLVPFYECSAFPRQ